MGMSDLYGPADDTESIATIHAALDAGLTLLDTGDYYGMGHNELLIRDALKGRNRDRIVTRLTHEIARLGGHCAHVHGESIDIRHDDAAGEAWLYGRFSFMLYRRPSRSR